MVISLLLLVWLQAQAQPFLTLENHQNVLFTQDAYSVQLHLGSPPQHFTLLVDTLHSYLQVDAVQCADCESTSRFHSSQSATYRTLKELRTRRWEGELGQDWAAFGKKGTLKVQSQAFFLNKRHSEMHNRGADGVFVSSR